MDHRAPATAAAFAALAFNGMTYAFMGTSLPMIQSYLGINIGLAGTLMAIFQTGVTVFSLIGGILSDFFRRERILMVGCFLLGASAWTLGTVPSFAISVCIVSTMGAGMGCILSGSNTLLVNLYPARKGMILNIHHVFFGIGSLVGPLIMGYLITRGNQWRKGYILESGLVLVLGILFLFSGGAKPTHRERSLLGSQLGKLIQDRHFMIIVTVCALEPCQCPGPLLPLGGGRHGGQHLPFRHQQLLCRQRPGKTRGHPALFSCRCFADEGDYQIGLINKPTLNVVDTDMLDRIGNSPFVLVVETQNRKTGLGSRYGTWLLENGYSPKYAAMGTAKEGQGGLTEQIPYQGMGGEDIIAKVKALMI